jgi:toxin ParE1/3/4
VRSPTAHEYASNPTRHTGLKGEPFEVRLATRAEDDLGHIAAWYMNRHPAGYDRFFEEFTTARNVLATFPFSGRPRDEIADGLRSYVINPYVAFYIVDEPLRRLTIARVIHGRMDFGPEDFEIE